MSDVTGWHAAVYYCPDSAWDRLLVARVLFDADGNLVGHRLVPDKRMQAIASFASACGDGDWDLTKEVTTYIGIMAQPAMFDASPRAAWDRRVGNFGNAMSNIQIDNSRPWLDTPTSEMLDSLIARSMLKQWEAQP